MSKVVIYQESLLKTYKTYLDKSECERVERMKKGMDFCKYLNEEDIEYDICIKHPEVLGCDESELYYKRFTQYLPSAYSICKHMLVKEKKGDRVFLIIVNKDKKVDLSKIREYLGCKKLEFVNEEEMRQLLDTYPGCVSVFCMKNDTDKKVELVIDYDLIKYQSLAFHPLYCGMSLFLKPSEMMKFIGKLDIKPNIIDVPAKEQEVGFAKVI